MNRSPRILRLFRAVIVAAIVTFGVAAPSTVLAQGIAPPSLSSVSHGPSVPTPASPYVTNGAGQNAMRAYSQRRGAYIHLSTVAVVLGVIILVLLLV